MAWEGAAKRVRGHAAHFPHAKQRTHPCHELEELRLNMLLAARENLGRGKHNNPAIVQQAELTFRLCPCFLSFSPCYPKGNEISLLLKKKKRRSKSQKECSR
jgi:hypothetical protein